MIIYAYVSMGLVGCKRKEEIEIEDENLTDEDIDDFVKQWMYEQIEWGWSREKPKQ
jgi:hypothetical protein